MRGSFESGCRLGMVACASVVAVGLSGCAVSGGGGGTTQPTGNTKATLEISADNNAQIPIVNFDLTSVTLLKTDGTSVPLMTTPQTVELGSLNGVARPLVTATVPQGLYTAVEIGYGPSTFVVIDESGGPGYTDVGHYNFGAPTSQPVTSKTYLATALNVTGNAMGILLNLNIPKSITFTSYFNGSGSSSIQPNGGATTFTPVYSLTAVTIAAQPSTMIDGLVEDVHGQVTASSSGALTMTSDDGATMSFGVSSATVLAGTTEPPPVGSYLDVDAALQQDGSMLATRVQTEGTQAYDMVGLINWYNPAYPEYFESTGRDQQGFSPGGPYGPVYPNNLAIGSSSQFAIAWPEGAAPSGLPFTPVFNASAFAVGQNVATPTSGPQLVSNVIPVVSTATLEPQTIDATVTAVSSANGVTTYQVTLFPDDLTVIFGPTAQVTVYATAATHTITSTPLGSGAVGRFRGLLFDDGGTMKMVASEVEDGVPGS